MINRQKIDEDLLELERHYNSARETRDLLFFSKLALLELCGWIEESMDDIISGCASLHLTDPKNISYIEENVIFGTSSFEYRKFREMLMRIVGLIGIEKIEKNYDLQKFDVMRSTPGTLRKYRDNAAHTHISGATQVDYTPSIIYREFNRVYAGLDDIEKCVAQLNP